MDAVSDPPIVKAEVIPSNEPDVAVAASTNAQASMISSDDNKQSYSSPPPNAPMVANATSTTTTTTYTIPAGGAAAGSHNAVHQGGGRGLGRCVCFCYCCCIAYDSGLLDNCFVVFVFNFFSNTPPQTLPNKQKRNPVTQTCPNCSQTVPTRTREQVNGLTIVAVIVLLFLFWPLFWLPLCMPSCKATEHYCSNCNYKIGTADPCTWIQYIILYILWNSDWCR